MLDSVADGERCGRGRVIVDGHAMRRDCLISCGGFDVLVSRGFSSTDADEDESSEGC